MKRVFGQKRWDPILFGIFSLINSVCIAAQTLNQPIVKHDLSSYLAPISSFLSGQGFFYSSYFDIKPPGIYILLLFWVSVFGETLKSLYILYFITLLIFHYFLLRIVFLYSGSFGTLLFGLLLIPVNLASNYFTMFFPIEVPCVALTVIGFYLLIKEKIFRVHNLIFASMAFVSAGLIKENFSLTIFLPILMTIYRKRYEFVYIPVLIGIIAYSGIFVWLVFNGAVGSYIEVLSFKKRLFPFPDAYEFVLRTVRIAWEFSTQYLILGNWTVGVIIALLIYCYLKRRSNGKHLLAANNTPDWLLYLLTLLLIGGFILQGKPLFGHYALGLNYFILLSIFVVTKSYLASTKLVNFKLILICVSILMIPNVHFMPSFQETKVLFVDGIDNWASLEADSETAKYQVFPKGECNQVAYGWASGAYYRYSGAKPCSKYFLAELIMGDDTLEESYRRSLVISPPMNIYYDLSEAGLDVDFFESKVFNWATVLNLCYKEKQPNYYESNFENSAFVSLCIKNNM